MFIYTARDVLALILVGGFLAVMLGMVAVGYTLRFWGWLTRAK